MRRITKWTLGLAILGGLYYVSCNHFIYFGGFDIQMLKKKKSTFSRTFFSTSLKTPEVILSDDVLREAGIADLLVKKGLLGEERKKQLMKRYEEED